MPKYIFIDESGDLGLGGSKYMVLTALLVTDYSYLDRIIKNMRRHKFKKELRKAQEIKACKSSEDVIKYMLCKLNEVPEIKILHVVLEKKKIFSEYLKNNKHKLYNYVAGKLAKNLMADEDGLEIRIDKSKGKQLLQEDFNAYFKKSLYPKANISIHHSWSHCWSGIQFADILAWSCFQKFEHSNSKYIDLLKTEQEVYHVW